MADIRVICDLAVTKPDGTPLNAPLTVGEAPAPINIILHSLFRRATVRLREKVISDSCMYHIRAYLEFLLGITRQAQRPQLTCAGWQSDTLIKILSFRQ